MKKAILTIIFLTTFFLLHAQQLMFEVYSGINATAYDSDILNNETKWYPPIGFRIAGGHEHVQLGIEYRKNIDHPVFDGIQRIEFEETYQGLFLRGNFSSLPAYRFGLVLKAGAGYYEARQNNYSLPSETLEQSLDLERQLGYNAGIGVSAPIYTLLHWEIGYQFNFVERPDALASDVTYRASYHSFQMGLSLNLVFGNTAKKCRRVMGGNRSKKGW